jgi:serine/threonine-protein phosphatase with EF-hand domain
MIRSHECEDDGFKTMHHGRLMTLFSASNYYEEESNLGAFVRLTHGQKPVVHQYMTRDDDQPRTLSLRRAVGQMERGAINQIRGVLLEYQGELKAAFAECDPSGTGKVSVKDWDALLRRVTQLQLPWIKLKDHFVEDNVGSGDCVEYGSFLKSVSGMYIGQHASVTLSDSIYRNRGEMETLFRLMDADKSGQLSREEFHRACMIINECSGDDAKISDDEIDALLKAMDRDGDGMVSFNEFLEAIRVEAPKTTGDSPRSLPPPESESPAEPVEAGLR